MERDKMIVAGFGYRGAATVASLRAALAGRSVTPSVFDMMLVLGREETILRIADCAE